MNKKYLLFNLAILSFLFNIVFSNSLYSQEEFHFGLELVPKSVYDTLKFAQPKFRGPYKEVIDLSDYTPFPGTQGKLGSCVGWALAYCLGSYYEMVFRGMKYNTMIIADTSTWENIFSPAFIYNSLNNGVDQGLYLIDALEFVQNIGMVKWKDMPYRDSDYFTKPAEKLKIIANQYRIKDFKKVKVEVDEFKKFLNDNDPILIAVKMDSSISYGGVKYNSHEPYLWKNSGGKTLGGHALTIVGYDNNVNAFKVQNSWDLDWGNKGFFWIDYGFLKNCVKEAYIIGF